MQNYAVLNYSSSLDDRKEQYIGDPVPAINLLLFWLKFSFLLNCTDTDLINILLFSTRSNGAQWYILILYGHIIVDCCLTQLCNISAISQREQAHFQWDDDEVRFEHDQHAELDCYSTSPLKQQSTGRHVASFWFRTEQFLLFLLNVACLAENQHLPIS